jgi:hypothetical protein
MSKSDSSIVGSEFDRLLRELTLLSRRFFWVNTFFLRLLSFSNSLKCAALFVRRRIGLCNKQRCDVKSMSFASTSMMTEPNIYVI